jgi:hypothetical protein
MSTTWPIARDRILQELADARGQRDAAIARLHAAQAQRDAAIAAEQAANTRLAAERRRTTEAQTQNTWEQAQQILDRIGYDPDAATHRAELLAAFHPKETRS